MFQVAAVVACVVVDAAVIKVSVLRASLKDLNDVYMVVYRCFFHTLFMALIDRFEYVKTPGIECFKW